LLVAGAAEASSRNFSWVVLVATVGRAAIHAAGASSSEELANPATNFSV
jgi:hypothetical protein